MIPQLLTAKTPFTCTRNVVFPPEVQLIPWYRVVRSDGTLPMGKRQRDLLIREGVPMRDHRDDLRRARVPAGLKIP